MRLRLQETAKAAHSVAGSHVGVDSQVAAVGQDEAWVASSREAPTALDASGDSSCAGNTRQRPQPGAVELSAGDFPAVAPFEVLGATSKHSIQEKDNMKISIKITAEAYGKDLELFRESREFTTQELDALIKAIQRAINKLIHDGENDR